MISDELMLSILAMDAYNRGYNPGIEGLGDPGSSLGNARFDAQSDIDANSQAVQQSFYAASYSYNGQTIISYRGTDVQPGLFPPTLGDAAMSLAI